MKVEFCSIALLCLTLALVLFFPLSKGGSIAGETVAANEWINLTPGSITHGELTAGGKAVFGFNVDQGKLIRFSIDKGDLGLSTVLYGPAGVKLLEHISQDFETVEVSFPVDSAGVYRIELQSRENVQAPRTYELMLQPLTTITSRDRKDSEARHAMTAAEVLRANSTAASLRQATEEFDKAAISWISVQDFSNASRATLKSGDVYFHLSKFSDAAERYEKAASFGARAGDRVKQAMALSQLGRLYSYKGGNDWAERYVNRALELLQHGVDPSTVIVRNAMGVALSNLAEVTYAKGNFLKSAAQCERALEFLNGDRSGQAKVHLFLTYLTGSSGNLSKAKSEISQTLNLYQATKNKSGEALALIAEGLLHITDNTSLAIKNYRQAIDVFHALGDRHSEAIALNAVGQVYELMKEYPIALLNFEEALRLFQDIGALDLAAVALFEAAKVHRLSKEFDQALVGYQHCLELSRAAGKSRTEVNVLNEIALVYVAQGKWEEASRQYQRVRKFYESIHDRRGQVMTLNNYGEFLLGSGKKREALDTYNRAIPMSQQVGDNEILTTTLYGIANTYRALGDYPTALSFVQDSIKILEEIRSNVSSPESRAAFVSGVWKHYELCTYILMELDRRRPGKGFGVDAFLLNEKSRARLLLDLLNEAQVDQYEPGIAKLLERERELAGYFTSLARYEMELSLSKKGSAELADVNKQLAELRSQYQELQARLLEQMPARPSLDRFTPGDLNQVQNQLRNSGTLLLDFHLGDERSYLWAVTADSFHTYELPSRKIIEEPAIELSKAIISRQEQNDDSASLSAPDITASDRLFNEKASVLSNMLFGPVAQELKNRKLLIVAQGALQYVPFEALPAPGMQTTPLIVTNEINRAVSLSTLIAIRAENKRVAAPDKIAAVIADPVFSKSDDRVQNGGLSGAIVSAAPSQNSNESAEPTLQASLRDKVPARLTHASEEADAISAAAPRGTTMIARGFDATYETAMSSSLGQYQILHFATHGFFDDKHPELSGIVLTMVDRNGVEKNGLMPLHDIYNLNLSAELTVLSACQTALGKDVKGEGLVGLTHSFISAGSKSVVASLWKVDDRATAALMTEFYKPLLQDGMTTGEALRTAKLKIMRDKRWGAPYYWAGFVLQGEYTNRITVGRNSSFGPVVLLLSPVLISSGMIFLLRRRRRSFPARRL